jgi:hypothetical protein
VAARTPATKDGVSTRKVARMAKATKSKWIKAPFDQSGPKVVNSSHLMVSP